jgi:hypothetical protein
MATDTKLKRISQSTETAVLELAQREGRTFIAQLDRVVEAGLQALADTPPTPAETSNA